MKMKMKAAVMRVQGKPRPYADSQPMTIEMVDLDPPGPRPDPDRAHHPKGVSNDAR